MMDNAFLHEKNGFKFKAACFKLNDVFLLSTASCNGSGTQGPGLQLAPKNFDDALTLDSNSDKSSSHSRPTIADSRY